MKNSLSSHGRFAFSVALASVLSFFVIGNRADAQQNQGVFVAQASARLTELVNAANKAGYALEDDSFSVGGGWVKQSTKNWVPLFTVQLTAGKEYRFLAAGDNDALDVDLEIRDADGKTVAVDETVKPEADVTFRPAKTGKYTVRVRLYESRNDLPCMCLAIMLAKQAAKVRD
jgi:hypothetical protein